MLPEKLSRKESLRRWRCHLFGIPHDEAARAEERDKGDMARLYRQRVPREKALAVLAEGGRLSQAAYLRCRVPYFTDGVALGGRAFVEAVFQSARDRFGSRRRQGAHPLRGLATADKAERLFNLRQLQKEVVT